MLNIMARISKLMPFMYKHYCENQEIMVKLQELDVASLYERSLMVQWVVGSIIHGGSIELFLIPASAPQLV